MKASAEKFLLYTPESETIRGNEQEVSAQIAETMRRISTAVGDQFRHTMRPVHAKSHGLLRARLTIQGDVPEQYRQGLFAEAGTFDAIVRLSTTPSDILPDSVSSPRAWAIKVIGTPQDAYSAARRIFVDEHLSFSPWHGLLAHQPLGSINRARRLAYQAAAAFRRMQEGRAEIEPTTIHELPV